MVRADMEFAHAVPILPAVDMKLPAGLSASLREGATRLAMMGDHSQSKREDVEHIQDFLLADLDGMAKSERLILCARRLGMPYGSPSSATTKRGSPSHHSRRPPASGATLAGGG